MRATEQYFQMALYFCLIYNTLYKVVLIFKSGDETLMCDHSNESY